VEKGRHALLIPWPVMYESVSTRMAWVGRRMDRINAHLKSLRTRGQLNFLDNTRFRDEAIKKCFPDTRSSARYRALSLVDIVIREILSERTIQTHALATFNIPDFYDVCRRFKKKILPE
jgi:hypothetical protein